MNSSSSENITGVTNFQEMPGTFDLQTMGDMIMKKLDEFTKSLTCLNVMILGKSGVGKSTLINSVFSEQLAETGCGRPVTQNIRRLTKEGFPLAIYDTPGLELAGENGTKNLLDEVTDIMDKGAKSGEIGKAIHCIWYCVSTSSHRFEQAEVDFLKKFLPRTSKYRVPVIVVLTQSFTKKDAEKLKAVIEEENLDIVQVIPILAQDYEIDEDYIAKAYGVDRLVQVMDNVIPDTVRDTLVYVQKANLKMKTNKAQAIIAASVATAAAAGATPIPFSDAAVLVPIQVSMMAGITAVYHLPIAKSAITALISASIGTSGTTVLGKSVVTGILKLIPGVGTVVGGVISGSVASVLTAALGEAYIGIMNQVYTGEMNMSDLETEDGKQAFAKMFKQQLSLKKNKKKD